MIKENQLRIGDIIFEDSDKRGAKIVKYFMRSPTVWHDLWRVITRRIKKSEYYHPVMYIGNNQVIEQQWKVEYGELNLNQKILVARMKNIDNVDRHNLKYLANEELGLKWGVINVLGKFATWLTGIKLFGRLIRWPSTEVSALRVARWYNFTLNETFGQCHYEDNTTQTMVDYIRNSDEWDVVYEG